MSGRVQVGWAALSGVWREWETERDWTDHFSLRRQLEFSTRNGDASSSFLKSLNFVVE